MLSKPPKNPENLKSSKIFLNSLYKKEKKNSLESVYILVMIIFAQMLLWNSPGELDFRNSACHIWFKLLKNWQVRLKQFKKKLMIERKKKIKKNSKNRIKLLILFKICKESEVHQCWWVPIWVWANNKVWAKVLEDKDKDLTKEWVKAKWVDKALVANNKASVANNKDFNKEDKEDKDLDNFDNEIYIIIYL